jgi:hypothetical protein
VQVLLLLLWAYEVCDAPGQVLLHTQSIPQQLAHTSMGDLNLFG